jgi:hypothetical protein
MTNLSLTKVSAYTVNSADSETTSSDKGLYSDLNIATVKAKGAGWYGSNGEARGLLDIWQDEYGDLYQVTPLGKFTDVAEKYKEDLVNSIKSKLTPEELVLVGIK